MIRDAVIALFLVACVSQSAFARQAQYRHLSVDDGLSQNTVYDILEDEHGFLWFATQDGLNRYTGYGFDVFNHDPSDSTSISNGWVTSILEDVDGDLWIGTHGGGLNHLDRATGVFHHFKYSDADSLSLPDDIVTDLEFDGDGHLWVSTYSGLARWSGTDFTRYSIASHAVLESDRIMVLETDAKGQVWLGTDTGGLYRVTDEHIERVVLPEARQNPDLNIVLSLFANEDVIWAGTAGGGVFEVSIQDQTSTRFALAQPITTDVRILSITREAGGDLLIGSDGAGLGRLQSGQRTIQYEKARVGDATSISTNAINKLMTDSHGALWIGHARGGIDYSIPFEFYNTGSFPSIRDNHVTGLLEDDVGAIWVGTDGGGLERLGPGNTYTSYVTPQITHDRILGLAAGPGSQLWVATGGGLNLLNPRTGGVRKWQQGREASGGLIDNRVFAVAASGEDAVWVATWGGLNYLNHVTGLVEHIRDDAASDSSLSNNRVISVLEDSQQRLWVGTLGGGLNLKHADRDGFIRFRYDPQDETSLTGDIVADVMESSDGTIWIATADGLNRYDEDTSSFERITRDDGLPNNTVYGIVEDDAGRLWMSTNNGMAVMEQDRTIRSFYASAGLQSNEFNQGAFAFAPSGALLFGGINGFNRFRPDQVLRQNEPRAALTSMSTSDSTWPVSSLADLKHIELRPGYSSLDLEFTSDDWRSPQTAGFEIKLEGADENWHFRTAGQRFTSYSRLKGGEYTFKVRTRGSDGTWSANVFELGITVVPPFSETRLFQLLLVFGAILLLGGIGYGWHLSRLAVLERKQEEQREVHRRLMDSREAERLHMARDLHDGAVQDLYGIRFSIQSSKDGETDNMVQGVISELRRICSELRPPVLAPFGLERAIRAHADLLVERDDSPTIQLDLDEDGQSIPEHVRLALYRVYQESMANVLKHANAASTRVRLRVVGPEVELEIEDDGSGFSPPSTWIELGRKDHFGLLGLSERVAALGAILQVHSSPGNGTRITVRVHNVHQASSHHD